MLLKDAPILVLDEATSALDSEVEAAIQSQLDLLMQGKTVIAIARLSTIARMDRLVVMEQAASSNRAPMTSFWRRAASMRGCGHASPAASSRRE